MPNPAPADPRGSLSLVDSGGYLLTRVAEHLHTCSEALLHRLSSEGLSPHTLLDAGRVLGLSELAAREAQELATVLLDESSRSG